MTEWLAEPVFDRLTLLVFCTGCMMTGFVLGDLANLWRLIRKDKR